MNPSNAASLSELLNNHRSIREFKADALDQALVKRILQEAIAGTSSSGNLNSVAVVLTQDAERKSALCDMHWGQEMIRQAPLLITFCADMGRTRRWLKLRNARDNFNNFQGFMVAAFDAILMSQSAALGFEANGLGICYLGTTLDACDQIADFLDLPETVFPVTSYVVGIPAENPAKRDRLPMGAFLHEERYHQPDEEGLLALYADREVKGWNRYRAMGEEMMAKMDAQGIKGLAQFYTSDLKYAPQRCLETSARLRKLLAETQFDGGMVA